MLTASIAVIFGLLFLVWSADRFVDGASATARCFQVPPLLIGLVIVGFGTSAPEIVVSITASLQGNTGIALGNAYGSNIANIGLILGLTALISPIAVQSGILRKELPILIGITALAIWLLSDGRITRPDALILLGVFAGFITWTIRQGLQSKNDSLLTEMADEEKSKTSSPLKKALFWLLVGLIGLVASSRLLVWGAVIIARSLGVSDLIIGLTIIAVGTSLPELASSIIPARKNEHDIALGNVLGSCMFNTLAVVGIAGLISPIPIEPEILYRDMPVMAGLTVSLFMLSYKLRGSGRIGRLGGGALLAVYIAYTAYLIYTAF